MRDKKLGKLAAEELDAIITIGGSEAGKLFKELLRRKMDNIIGRSFSESYLEDSDIVAKKKAFHKGRVAAITGILRDFERAKRERKRREEGE